MRKSRWWAADAETISSRLSVPLENVLSVLDNTPDLRRNEYGEYHIPQLRALLSVAPESRAQNRTRDVPRNLRDVRTYDDAHLLREMKQVELAQVRLDQLSGKLVPKAEVERHLSGLASAVRAVIAAAPSRHASLLSARFSTPLHDMRMALDAVFDEVGENLKNVLSGGR